MNEMHWLFSLEGKVSMPIRPLQNSAMSVNFPP